MEIGSYVQVNLANNEGYYRVIPDDEPHIDIGVSRWIESGETQNMLLQLTCMDGCTVKILASAISDWFVSTSDSRQKALELQKAYQDEEKGHKMALGMWEET